MSRADRSRRSRRRRLSGWLAVGVLALAPAACGQEGDAPGPSQDRGPGTGGEMLPAADVERVIRAQRRIAACDGRRSVDAAVSQLIEIHRVGPEQVYRPPSAPTDARTMDDVLAETRTGLRRCGDDDAIARIDDALAAQE